MDVSTVLNFVTVLRSRLEHLEKRKMEVLVNIAKTKGELEAACNAKKATVESEVNRTIARPKEVALKKLTEARRCLSAVGFSRTTTYSSSDFLNDSIEENLRHLDHLFLRLEEIAKILKGTIFDRIDHPMTYTPDYTNFEVIGKDLTTRETRVVSDPPSSEPDLSSSSELIREVDRLAAEAEARIEAVGKQYHDTLRLSDYYQSIRRLSEELFEEYKEREESMLDREIRRLLAEEDEVINAAFFHELETSGAEFAPNLETGSSDFRSAMTLGTLDISFTDDFTRFEPLIRYSPLLRRHVAAGVVRSPMILNLKEKGNILLDEANPDGQLSPKAIAFIHQFIQGFLLSQPSGRVNLCLADFNDQCKFNRYAPLKSINTNALFKGIIRSERDIDSIISDIEKLMFDISDNKLSFNGVDDIFEYNQRSEENPQSMHLMVLLDFPEKYSADTISHIEKIVANGNNSGIYTLIVRNPKAHTDFGSRQNIYDSAVNSILKNSIHITETNRCFQLAPDRYFTPLNNLPIADFSKNVFPVLEKNANEQKQTVIPMAPMFELSDQYHRNNSDPLMSSKLIEIPIGKNGGEVQSIKFSTTGDNAAHALVIGGTGSGKSNLLHAIILSACYRYSPKELQIYLIDFKGGVEFKYYEAGKVLENQLPHISLTGLTSEPEDGVAILTNIRSILRERENLFRRNDVEDIVQYDNKFGKEGMLPRLLIIIDEVQELFAHERLSQQALTILGELFKKGRAFGISILWASQTVPKTVGGDFKDKVLSQIGNRICLKLNNADDAEAIGFNASKVRSLNRPEKGLGIIYDGMDFVEFRVAYAEKKDNRLQYIHLINRRWASELRGWTERKPLFIVGDDEIPKASEGAAKYLLGMPRVKAAKSGEEYDLSLGQDYISGDPFRLPIALRGSKENCWIAGKNAGMLRDALGYAMLSVALENYTNSDMTQFRDSIYYFNGELMGKDKDDLFYALPGKLSDMITTLDSYEVFVDTMIRLYKIRKERYSHMSAVHPPIFVFINKMQILGELFADSKQYSVSDEAPAAPAPAPAFTGFTTFGGASAGSAGGSRMTFRDIMRELLSRGSDVGIHFVLTFNDPCSIPELKNELRDFVHKLVLFGVSPDSVAQITDNYLMRDKTPTKEGVAFCYRGSEMMKLKLYQYDAERDESWLDRLLTTYQK